MGKITQANGGRKTSSRRGGQVATETPGSRGPPPGDRHILLSWCPRRLRLVDFQIQIPLKKKKIICSDSNAQIVDLQMAFL